MPSDETVNHDISAASADSKPFPWRDIINKKLDEEFQERRKREEERQRRETVTKLIVKKNEAVLDQLEKLIASDR